MLIFERHQKAGCNALTPLFTGIMMIRILVLKEGSQDFLFFLCPVNACQLLDELLLQFCIRNFVVGLTISMDFEQELWVLYKSDLLERSTNSEAWDLYLKHLILKILLEILISVADVIQEAPQQASIYLQAEPLQQLPLEEVFKQEEQQIKIQGE
ncbi:unnamed protein product [Lactuca saligna]|uniref:Uncharacterized protein n=1 Tax=Lactuca saligna TaxID=75948 RepID=A0AA35ZNZ5_LACSI|nr:unnamed protein product [Lactuca saligna]